MVCLLFSFGKKGMILRFLYMVCEKKISTISLIFQQIQQHLTKRKSFRQAKILPPSPKFPMESDSVFHRLTGFVLCGKNREKT